LSYSWRNFAADDRWEPRDGGLSMYGFELVEAMNKKGLLIDLSHVGDNSTIDAIESSKVPVSFTNVCPRKITPTSHSKYVEWAGCDSFIKLALERGRTDESLQACAEKGGVMGVKPFFAKKILGENWVRLFKRVWGK
jgi:membrane dipeptidase